MATETITISKEVAEKQFDEFMESLELDRESMDDSSDVTLEDGQVVKGFNLYESAKRASVRAICAGRLVLDGENECLTYTFKKPLRSGDVEKTFIKMDVSNVQFGQIEPARERMTARKDKDVFAGVSLFSSGAVPPNLLKKMRPSESNLLTMLSLVFFSL